MFSVSQRSIKSYTARGTLVKSRVQALLPLVSLSVFWEPVRCPGESLGSASSSMVCVMRLVLQRSEWLWRLFHTLSFSYSRQLAPSRERRWSRVNKSLLLVHSLSTDKTLALPSRGTDRKLGTLWPQAKHARDLREGQL